MNAIRSYQMSDREAVFRIAADTAFFGEPVEAFLEDRRLFCDAFCASYLDLGPQTIWVAVGGEDEVIGYLMGCPDTAAHDRKWQRSYLGGLVRRAVQGYYRVGNLTLRYALSLGLAYVRGEIPHADLRAYPAHLHINVDARYRGMGLGRQLIQAYLDQLRSLGIPGVHLFTTSHNRAACHLYEKVGFRILASHRTRTWQKWVSEPVENRCYGLALHNHR